MADPARDALVSYSMSGRIATITMDSPGNRNALSKAFVDDLHVALDQAEHDDVRVIVLGHSGNTFCAGADLKERSNGPVDSTPVVAVFRRLMESTRPTIAAVGGFVRAGGIGLMASCDLVVVKPTVDFAFTEVRLGLAPAMISVPILRRCPPARVTSWWLTAERFDATEARSAGLVDHVADDVAAKVASLCDVLLMAGPRALTATKEILRAVPGETIDVAFPRMQRLSESLFESAEGTAGMRAFLAGQPPPWAS